MKILVIYDLDTEKTPFSTHKFSGIEYETERHVFRTLKKLGHTVSVLGVFDTIDPLIKIIDSGEIDLVFNLCESFQSDRKFESYLPSLFELKKIKYTGGNPEIISLCANKYLTKNLLEKEKILTPRYALIKEKSELKNIPLNFPVILKINSFDGSESISKKSICTSQKELEAKAMNLFKKFPQNPILIEEYIQGKDIFVGIIFHQNKIRALAPMTIQYAKNEKYPIATFQVKWNENYQKSKKIKFIPFQEKELLKQIRKKSLAIATSLAIKSYTRLDFRLNEKTGDLYFLEANPNPNISKFDELAQSAKKEKINYETLIASIIKKAA